MNRDRLQKILACFGKSKIIVVGDVMLDHFLWGKVSRISPEAPVPIVEVTRESYFPGGAANVARNLRALGAPVKMLGVIGDDDSGEALRELLEQRGVQTHGLVIDSNRPTTLKTRIVAHHQQVVRFDREKVGSLSPVVGARLMEFFRSNVEAADAVIFEDYGKGVLTQSSLDSMQRLAKQRRKITSADPNSRHPLRFSGLTVVTPNRAEAFAAAKLPYAEPADEVLGDGALLKAGKTLLQRWKPDNLLVTLGEHGMCLFRANKRPHHIPTVAQEVFDVSGAGDTVIATLTLALAAGANPVEAAEISNHAAGVVVGKIGTATCSTEELVESFRRDS